MTRRTKYMSELYWFLVRELNKGVDDYSGRFLIIVDDYDW